MFQVIWIKKIDYIKKDGNRALGLNLFCVDLTERKDLQGNACAELYISSKSDGWETANQLKINDTFTPYYTQRGMVGQIVKGGK